MSYSPYLQKAGFGHISYAFSEWMFERVDRLHATQQAGDCAIDQRQTVEEALRSLQMMTGDLQGVADGAQRKSELSAQ